MFTFLMKYHFGVYKLLLKSLIYVLHSPIMKSFRPMRFCMRCNNILICCIKYTSHSYRFEDCPSGISGIRKEFSWKHHPGQRSVQSQPFVSHQKLRETSSSGLWKNHLNHRHSIYQYRSHMDHSTANNREKLGNVCSWTSRVSAGGGSAEIHRE